MVLIIYQNVNRSALITNQLIEHTWTAINTITIICEFNKTSIITKFSDRLMIIDDNILILVTPDLEWKKINTIRGYNIIAIELLKLSCLIVGVYMPSGWVSAPKKRSKYIICLRIIKTILEEQRQKSKVIVGDWNTESSIWCHKPNITMARSKINQELESILASFEPITKDLITFTDARGNKSHIDMILTNHIPGVVWQTINNTSDHVQFKISVQLSRIKPEKKTGQMTKKLVIGSWYFDKIDMPRNYMPLTKHHPLVINCRRIVHFPDDHGIWRYERTAPNNRLARLIRKRKKLRRDVTKDRDKKLAAINVSIRSQIKRTRLYHIYNNISNTKQMWRSISNNIRKSSPINWNDSITKESKTKWLAEFSYKRPIFKDYDTSIPGELKTWEKERIKRLNFKTSSLNADNYTPATWKRFKEKNIDQIVDCVGEMFRLSSVPNILNVLGCGFVKKQNTKEVRMVKSSSYIMKIVGTIINDRLMSYVDDWLLPNSQFGFGKNNRREFFYHNVVSTIDKMDENIVIIKLDICKAFDNVLITKTLAKLKNFADKGTHNMIETLSKDRWLTYWDNERKRKLYCRENSHISQGQPYSPVLFAFTLDFAIRKIRTYGIVIFAYADDLLLLTTACLENQHLILIKRELMMIGLILNDSKMERFVKKETPLMDIIGFWYMPKGRNLSLLIRQFELEKREIILSLGEVWTKIYKLPEKLKRTLISGIILPKLYKYVPQLLLEGRLKAVETIGTMLNALCLNNETKWAWLIIHNYQNILLTFEHALQIYEHKKQNEWMYKNISQTKISKLIDNELKRTICYEICGRKFKISNGINLWSGKIEKIYKSQEQRECLILYNILLREQGSIHLSKYAISKLFDNSLFGAELRSLIWHYKEHIYINTTSAGIGSTGQNELVWPLSDYKTTWRWKIDEKNYLREQYIETFKKSSSPLIHFEWPEYKFIRNPRTRYLLSTLTRFKKSRYCDCGKQEKIIHHLTCYTNMPSERRTKPLSWRKEDIDDIKEIIIFFS